MEAITRKYLELMDSLSEIPHELAEAEEEEAHLRSSISRNQRTLEEREALVVMKEGGWGALGKNEGDRKYRLKQLLIEDAQYQRMAEAIEDEQQTLAEVQVSAEALRRQYGAVTYQARLHAAYMAYMAGASTMPTAIAEPVASAEELGL